MQANRFWWRVDNFNRNSGIHNERKEFFENYPGGIWVREWEDLIIVFT